jgi:SAM-dependent methyltransferase
MNQRLQFSPETTLHQMDLWYRTDLGMELLRLESNALKQYLADYRVGCLLQIGGPSAITLYENASFVQHVRYSPEHTSTFHGPSICGALDELPFQPGSLEMVLLPHVLEFVSDPEQLLADIYQALAPEGRVIILAFNAWSLWGMTRWFKHRRTVPWRGRFYSELQLKKWLLRQKFTLEENCSVFFRPPMPTKFSLHRGIVLEAIGSVLWGNHGAVNLIVAKKPVVSLLPADPRLAKKAAAADVLGTA